MLQSQSENFKKLVPLKKIAEASSYSFSYVSVLVQRKKLKAKKVGNKYYSTAEWFNQYLELHAQDGKKLSLAPAQKLPPGGAPDKFEPAVSHPFLEKRRSEINNFIDDLTEHLDRKKFKAPKAPAQNNLARILNDKIILPEVELIADFIEPEIRLETEWLKILNKEIKNLLERPGAKKTSIFRPWLLTGAAIALAIFFLGATAGFNQTVNRVVGGLKPPLEIFSDKAAGLSKNNLALLSSFINYQGESIGEIFYMAKDKFFPPPGALNSARSGRVAGVAEVNEPDFFSLARFTALTDMAARRGREIISHAKDNSIIVLENTAGRQKDLSLNFGKKSAEFILAGAKKINSMAKGGRNKLAQLKNTIEQVLAGGK
ncbi:MAG: hypothetical protein WCV70_04035 [Patescibacteria group bacterium]|jgi:hypothetical protein